MKFSNRPTVSDDVVYAPAHPKIHDDTAWCHDCGVLLTDEVVSTGEGTDVKFFCSLDCADFNDRLEEEYRYIEQLNHSFACWSERGGR